MSGHKCGKTGERPNPRLFESVPGGMELSSDHLYRNRLWHRWAEGPSITWIMLNPSDADPDEDGYIRPDRTIKRIISFSKAHEPNVFGALEVVNLFAIRDSCSACALTSDNPYGDDDRLRSIIKPSMTVVIAWGDLEKGSCEERHRNKAPDQGTWTHS